MKKKTSLIKVKPKKYKIGDIVKVSFIVRHPMNTGAVKDKKTGKLIPANYINEVKFLFNSQAFTSIKTWETLSQNPVLSVNYKVPAKGELSVTYTDNKGEITTKTKKLKPKA